MGCLLCARQCAAVSKHFLWRSLITPIQKSWPDCGYKTLVLEAQQHSLQLHYWKPKYYCGAPVMQRLLSERNSKLFISSFIVLYWFVFKSRDTNTHTHTRKTHWRVATDSWFQNLGIKSIWLKRFIFIQRLKTWNCSLSRFKDASRLKKSLFSICLLLNTNEIPNSNCFTELFWSFLMLTKPDVADSMFPEPVGLLQVANLKRTQRRYVKIGKNGNGI